MSAEHYPRCELLLPFDGTNGATTATDYSFRGRSPTFAGNAAITTGQSKYYGSSLYLDGAGDWVELPADRWLVIGTRDFTVDGWMRTDGAINNRVIAGMYSGGGWQIMVSSGGKLQLYGVVTSSASINDGNWHHFEVSRTGGRQRLFVDGVLDGDVANSTDWSTIPAKFEIGAQVNSRNATYDYKGWMQDIRVVVGAALHTATFTPPGKMVGTLTGTIRDETGATCARGVAAFDRTYPHAIRSTTSAGDGVYTLRTIGTGEHTRVALASGATLLNDLVDRVYPG